MISWGGYECAIVRGGMKEGREKVGSLPPSQPRKQDVEYEVNQASATPRAAGV